MDHFQAQQMNFIYSVFFSTKMWICQNTYYYFKLFDSKIFDLYRSVSESHNKMLCLCLTLFPISPTFFETLSLYDKKIKASIEFGRD